MALVALLVLGGCTRLQEVPLHEGGRVEAVQPGDKVRVTLRDGTARDLQVTAVEPEALVAGEERIATREIAKLERREVDETRTGALIAGSVLLVLTATALLFAAVAPAMFLGGG
ncbi:MAG: hypothetical protein N3D77_12690 [Geminicoccaceae bacterium]|nr:hypothetical protein [Geminicoccaceae bacterium]